jgi:drug/metabolite transporter (DMT)-like permease
MRAASASPSPSRQGAGYLALGETLTPVQLAGAGVTLGAVYLINSRSAK